MFSVDGQGRRRPRAPTPATSANSKLFCRARGANGCARAYAWAMEQAAGSAIRDPLIGTVLDERYRVIRRIGRGGMGIVYLAQHVLIGRKYAIKTLSERTNATEEMVARFHREAVAAAAVGSQHVVEVTDMGRLPDGTLYIALEYLDGIELANAVRAEGPFSVARAVHVACQLCDALGAVHEQGIVHRDLKPENLFLIEQRGVKDFLKVLDFGICKLLEGGAHEDDPDKPALTRTNASLGTPQYMAPEQFQSSARVDQRADLHAVGAILYFMLTGKPPFDAPTMAQLYMRICVEPPPALLARRPDVPFELDRAMRRAMSKHPEDRFPNSAALKSALLPFADFQGERPSHVEALAAGIEASTASSETTRQPTPVAQETALETELPLLTPRLPERRWRRPALAITLVAFAICSMGFGAWALAPAGRSYSTRNAVSSSARDRVQPLSRELVTLPAASSLRDEGVAADIELPTLPATKTAPQAARPKTRAKPPAASAPVPPLPAESTPPAAVESAPEVEERAQPETVSGEAADASFHFPRRALKSVF
jgi:serine/threonine protein kinase